MKKILVLIFLIAIIIPLIHAQINCTNSTNNSLNETCPPSNEGNLFNETNITIFWTIIAIILVSVVFFIVRNKINLTKLIKEMQ